MSHHETDHGENCEAAQDAQLGSDATLLWSFPQLLKSTPGDVTVEREHQ